MRWESLQIEQFGIYQDEALGRFTEDPVRLVHFLHAKKSERALDLGTGNGVIPIYANALYGCPFAGLDVDEAQLDLARLSAERNGQDIPFYALDVSAAPGALGYGRFDLVTMNPPYYSEATAGEAQKWTGMICTPRRAIIQVATGLSMPPERKIGRAHV